jgi:hypothetical protein
MRAQGQLQEQTMLRVVAETGLMELRGELAQMMKQQRSLVAELDNAK